MRYKGIYLGKFNNRYQQVPYILVDRKLSQGGMYDQN